MVVSGIWDLGGIVLMGRDTYLFPFGNHIRNCQYSPRLYTQASSNIAISPSAKFCFLSAKFARRVTIIFSSHTFVQHSV